MLLTAAQAKLFNPKGLVSNADLASLPADYHAILAPSSMSRVMLCPASAQASLRCAIQPQSVPAFRGSLLHEFVVDMYLNKTKIDGYLGNYTHATDGIEYKVTVDDMEQVKECVRHLMLLERTYGKENIWLEQSGSLAAFGIPFIHGTADVVVRVGKTLFIIDWKFGTGVQVFVHEHGTPNPQLMNYALMHMGNVEEVNLRIVQPPHFYDETTTISADELRAWFKDYFRPVIKEAVSDKPRFNPGIKQCRFCPYGTRCMKRAQKMANTMKEIKRMHSNLNVREVSNEEIGRIILAGREVKNYLTAIEKEGLNIALDTGLPGLKAVHGRMSRKWKSEKEAIAVLEREISIDDMYNAKLVSPAQAEKKCREFKKLKEFQAVVVKKPGKLQLVSEDDPRQGVSPENEALTAFKDDLK